MTKFMFVYRRPEDSAGKISPEEMQKGMEKWQAWIAEGLQKGWLVDRGNGLTQEGRVVTANKLVVDGPFVESKEIVGGFSIIQADTIDAAAELAKSCPALLSGGHVEVRVLWDQSK
jgi:hypothetical protein